jgi:hypothetical protein
MHKLMNIMHGSSQYVIYIYIYIYIYIEREREREREREHDKGGIVQGRGKCL